MSSGAGLCTFCPGAGLRALVKGSRERRGIMAGSGITAADSLGSAAWLCDWFGFGAVLGFAIVHWPILEKSRYPYMVGFQSFPRWPWRR